MMFPIDYRDDRQLRNAFTYAARTGIGLRFPGTPIGWYQQHQVAALDELERRARAVTNCPEPNNVRVRLRVGMFEARQVGSRRWHHCGTPQDIYRATDRALRS